MKLFTAEEALQMLLDSEEEFTVSSDEEQDSDEEHLYFEERLDPAEDIISEENVAASLLSSPAPAATLSPPFDARTGARSNENNKENVASTSSDTRTRARSNATDIHPVNVSASPLPATNTRRRSLSVLKATETNVFNTDSDNAPVAKRLKTNIQASSRQSVLSWKTETDIDVVPHTLSFFPAREPGPQLSPADAHTPLSLFKMFFHENAVSTLSHNTNAQAGQGNSKGLQVQMERCQHH
ncbi:uncharacterized protein LOC113647947 [Tachysurus fulvidraco]|uniref:uncharacterized protein LOC113647947 n=1 Tax=Tachysurus fulvidraco TaxID=1234273 RepID=UPI001FF01000|nr:uncharacterized protein LOC113647947 [Tachysurus fulvidraco]